MPSTVSLVEVAVRQADPIMLLQVWLADDVEVGQHEARWIDDHSRAAAG